MLRYLIKRFISMIVTLFIIITLTFFLMQAIPGDPFTDATRVPPEVIEMVKAKYGLDKPVVEQYAVYMKNIIKGDLGVSLKYKNRTVNEIIKEGFPVSASLGIISGIFGIAVGLAFGIIAGVNNQKFWDYLVVLIAVVGVSVPSFVIAALLQLLFGVKLNLLPTARWGSVRHVIMPMLALSLGVIAFQARMMRTSVVETMRQEYIKTARAKGLCRREILRRHVLRNSIIPSVTVIGPVLAGLLCGTFVIEKIFAIPGLGKYYIMSIQQSDYTVIMGMTIFYSIILLTIMLLVDIAYGIVDPRIKINK
jgi:oligopeptide transport system permease protein